MIDLDDVLARMGWRMPEYSYGGGTYERDKRVSIVNAKNELETYIRKARTVEAESETYKEIAVEQVKTIARLELEVERLKARAEIVGDQLEPLEP